MLPALVILGLGMLTFLVLLASFIRFRNREKGKEKASELSKDARTTDQPLSHTRVESLSAYAPSQPQPVYIEGSTGPTGPPS